MTSGSVESPDATLPTASYQLSRWIFLRLLGLTYLLAFSSLATQVLGLVGAEGILPINDHLDRAREVYGIDAIRRYPTLLWISSSDRTLMALCWCGALFSGVLMWGFAPKVTLVLLWFSYLSLAVAGQTFLAFQWDALLLETGLLACFYAPRGSRPHLATEQLPSRMGRWLLWWLLFRLMFLSGITKLASGDPAWADLTALSYHYQTQPLPFWTGWYVHQFPVWLHQFSAALMFVIELLFPFAIFLSARWQRARLAACVGLVLLQLTIGVTGNYGFFSILSVVLCLTLVDDLSWRQLLPARLCDYLPTNTASHAPHSWPVAVTVLGATVLIALSSITFVREIARTLENSGRPSVDLTWSDPIVEIIQPFRSINGYGLFRVMTTERPEIVIEGSHDGTHWTEWELRWKPGDPMRRPRLAAPHQPRLDWQLWFAALDPRGDRYWLLPLMRQLLTGAPATTALMDKPPFGDTPPRYLRLAYYDYQFTTPEERAETGAWWRRVFFDYLTEPISLNDLR